MFSFHKPKVYRSTSGCCICKAKSSSSRFTDSRKYEEDFVDCFQLEAPRSGEVCNACVLLVKRWKKLPPGNQRNWRHVVDARSGPGTKSFVKVKSKKNLKYKIKCKKHSDGVDLDNAKKVDLVDNDVDFEMNDISEETEQLSDPPSPIPSPSGSPVEELVKMCRRPKKRVISPPVSSFLDMTYWKEEKVCCGVIFKGPHNEIIIDPRLMTPCSQRRAAAQSPPVSPPTNDPVLSVSPPTNDPVLSVVPPTNDSVPPVHPPTTDPVPAPVTKAYSDNSSDSGYDESSNPGEVQSNTSHN